MLRGFADELREVGALWRAHIEDLAGTLSDEGVVGRAAEELRGVIDALVVRYDATTRTHTVELRGKLLEMLKKQPRRREGVCRIFEFA